jgi:hypothetical protein
LADLRGNAAADLNEHRWNVLLGRHAALWEWNQAPAGRSRGAPSLWKSLGADSRISFM